MTVAIVDLPVHRFTVADVPRKIVLPPSIKVWTCMPILAWRYYSVEFSSEQDPSRQSDSHFDTTSSSAYLDQFDREGERPAIQSVPCRGNLRSLDRTNDQIKCERNLLSFPL